MSIVEELCGVYPEDFEKLDISSNPDFVFTNDLNYSAKQLFDTAGNKISVNSFVECEHYVSGGWNFTPVESSEFLLQDNLIYISLFLLVLTFLRPKLIRVFKN